MHDSMLTGRLFVSVMALSPPKKNKSAVFYDDFRSDNEEAARPFPEHFLQMAVPFGVRVGQNMAATVRLFRRSHN